MHVPPVHSPQFDHSLLEKYKAYGALQHKIHHKNEHVEKNKNER
jgi:hypothetical protein